jgi:hypothetical protein
VPLKTLFKAEHEVEHAARVNLRHVAHVYDYWDTEAVVGCNFLGVFIGARLDGVNLVYV